MKDHSFYQSALTARGRKDDKGKLAEDIFSDLSFPKHESDFSILSDYIKIQGDITLSISVFDDLCREYTERLKL